MSGMDIVIRPIEDSDLDGWTRASAWAFGHHATDEYVRVNRLFTELDRTFGAFDGDEIVGTTTTRTSAMTIPGGVAKLGFVDDVTVLPTRRRRGIMTRMMRAQLDQMRERGEPLAALTASESLIYERFGYGIATWAHRWEIDRRHTRMKIPPSDGGDLRFISADDAREAWPELHARVRGNRVGMIHYDAAYWRVALWDSEGQRDGATAFFHVAYMREGRVAGLCSYRGRERTIRVAFLLGEDAEVEAELWRFCFGIDLVTGVWAIQPTDDPLPWRLEDPRRLERSLIDHFWLRLVDAREALASRRYAEAGSLTLRVQDEFCPWNDGMYRLEGGPEGAECSRRSDGEPQIELSASDLAAAYLGGVTFSTLARAGRVVERESGALATADRMFRTERAPWSLEL